MVVVLNIFLIIALFLVMVGIGLSIKPKELLKTLRKPKRIFFGILLQILVFPLIAFFLLRYADIDPVWKVGIIILAACPPGALSNLLTAIVKGNVSLSVELTSINSFISLITLPIYITLAFNYYLTDFLSFSLPIGNLIITLLLITTVPVLIGTWLRYKRPMLAKKRQKQVKFSGAIFFSVILIIKFAFSNDGSPIPMDHIITLLPWVLGLNVAGVALAYISSRLIGFDKKVNLTFAAEIGVQNTVLALFITETLFRNSLMGEPALIYSIFSFALGLGLCLFMKKRF